MKVNKNSKSLSLPLPTTMEEITVEETTEIIIAIIIIIILSQLLALVEVRMLPLHQRIQYLRQTQQFQIIQITTQTITPQTKTTIIPIIQIIQNQSSLQKEHSPHSMELLQITKQLLRDKRSTISQEESLTIFVQLLYKPTHTMNL